MWLGDRVNGLVSADDLQYYRNDSHDSFQLTGCSHHQALSPSSLKTSVYCSDYPRLKCRGNTGEVEALENNGGES